MENSVCHSVAVVKYLAYVVAFEAAERLNDERCHISVTGLTVVTLERALHVSEHELNRIKKRTV